MNKKIQLVIPAAGSGSRFVAAGFQTIKPLIKVFEIPMINWVIANFPIEKLEKVVVIVKRGDNIEQLLENWFIKNRLPIEFVVIDELSEGPADTVSRALPHLDKSLPMVIANSDQFVVANLSKFIDQLIDSQYSGLIMTMKATGKKWSYVGRNNKGKIDRVVEKVEISSEATVGIYGWKKADLFEYSFNIMRESNDRTNGEFYVAPTYNYLIQNHEIESYEIGLVEKDIFGLGTPEDLHYFMQNGEMLCLSEEIRARTI